MFDWKWYLKDIRQDKEISVFSCFSCGGGSTMGYKRAGFHVLGNVEIDERVNRMYVQNHHPMLNFCMDLRDFNRLPDLPEELTNLDILDGSPPCTVFSMAGQREATWGKAKKFAEGQKKQILDDLFFVWLDTVERLRPRIAIAENVMGLLQKNAKGYVNAILNRFHTLGYGVQMFKLNAAFMEVPQVRERVFFIANRCGFPKLKLEFNEKPILFREVKTAHGKPLGKNAVMTRERLRYLLPTDTCIADIVERTEGKHNNFNTRIIQDHRVADTIVSSSEYIRACDKARFSDDDFRNVATFPQDYIFSGKSPQYVCGMSVPPNMMAHIAAEIWRQWLRQGG